MTDSIFLLHPDLSVHEVRQVPYEHERDLQQLLDAHPELIPGALINPEKPRRWLLVKSEAGIPSEEGGGDWWAVDHLLLDQEGMPTFVEVKRATDTRTRRAVVAQMLEYAANGTAYWHVDTLRSWLEEPETPAGPDGDSRVEEFLEDEAFGVEEFWAHVGENLEAGRVRLVFVADAIPATLRRLVEFLNEHLDTVEVLAVEIPQYASTGEEEWKAVVPRLVGQTERARAVKGRALGGPVRPLPWKPEEVLDAIKEQTPDVLPVAETVIRWAQARPDVISIEGGKGLHYPGVMIAVDTRRPRSRVRKVLALYGGDGPALEIRFIRMIKTHPYNRKDMRERLLRDLEALRIPRLSGGPELLHVRPNVPLGELDETKVDGILRIMDRWIEDVRAVAGDAVEDEEDETGE